MLLWLAQHFQDQIGALRVFNFITFRAVFATLTALLIGLIAGPACYAGAVWLKHALKYDDSLDAFGVHGIGGILGALLTGVFATTSVNALAEGATVWKQAVGLAGAIAWSAAGTFLVLMICKFTTGLRVARDEEVEGLDYTQHGEAIH
jgi:Amt family ammonium transporter